MSDEIIYQQLLQHNQQAITYIFEKYGGLIKYIISGSVTLTEEESEECISDVLFNLWKRVEKYDSTKSSFKSWLIIVTRGTAIDYYRKIAKHKKTIFLEELTSPIIFHEEFDKLGVNKIIELLQMLPPPDNEIFYDRFVLGEEIEKIARKHNISKDNAYKRINRGRKKLKEIFQKEGF